MNIYDMTKQKFYKNAFDIFTKGFRLQYCKYCKYCKYANKE